MPNFEEFITCNQQLWDDWATLHSQGDTECYDLKAFKAGASSLTKIELAELGNLEDKSLLHLQCHIGLDTLSLARKGANVTGIDFSSEAIHFARELSKECEIPAHFICSDIYKLSDVLADKFDIVFTSYGVLTWLYDIDRWAEIITNYLKPGGTFYIVEFHPFTHMFDEQWQQLSNNYFYGKKPISTEEQGSYSDKTAELSGVSYEWPHTLSEIIMALRKVGLVIELFNEFPFSPYNCFPSLEEKIPGEFTIAGQNKGMPLTFSIKATYIPELAQKG